MSDDYIKTLENENVRLRGVILRQQNEIDSLKGPKKVDNTNISNNIIVIDSLSGVKNDSWNAWSIKKCKRCI